MVRMKETVKNDFPTSTFQRAGYIAENILGNKKLSNIFENILPKKPFKTVLLKSSGSPSGIRDDKWKVIINIEIEGD
jgi:predicted transcriptional regulator of viral defense system